MTSTFTDIIDTIDDAHDALDIATRMENELSRYFEKSQPTEALFQRIQDDYFRIKDFINILNDYVYQAKKKIKEAHQLCDAAEAENNVDKR